MENEPFTSDGRSKKRDRLMGKLFGKDRKSADSNNFDSQSSVDDFLRSSTDTLSVTHAPPPPPPSTTSVPKLSKLDTTVARFPQAVGVNQQAQQNRPLALGARPDPNAQPRAPRPNRKGLLVRFADTYPEIIGEGGDETEIPPIKVSRRKQARPPAPKAPVAPPAPPSYHPSPQPQFQTHAPVAPAADPNLPDGFQPKPLSRTPTGISSGYEPESEDDASPVATGPPPMAIRPGPSPRLPPSPNPPSQQPPPALEPGSTLRPGRASSARYLESTGRHDVDRRSFIEVHQAEMRQAEGQAFARAAKVASTASEHDWVDGDHPPSPSVNSSPELARARPVSPVSDVVNPGAEYSPAASIPSETSSMYGSPDASWSQTQRFPARNFSRRDVPSGTDSAVAPYSVAPTDGGNAATQEPEPAPAPPLPAAPPAAPPIAGAGAGAGAGASAGLASLKMRDVVIAAGDDALGAFVARTTHLFELFRLHAETIQPLSSCDIKSCARAGLWWFLKGRLGLEKTIRERPTSPQSQMQNDIERHQSYTNLAKGYWFCEKIIPEVSGLQNIPPDSEVAEVCRDLVSALRKMAMSMKRNNILPPEEAFLPQTIDKSVWVEYPALSHDMVALLSGNWGSGMSAMQQPLSTLHLLDAFPLGDTADTFSYGRVMADSYLMEQGREAQQFHFPSMLSMVRPQKHTGLIFVIASQNGSLQLAIQESRSAGPVWDDVRWRSETCALEVRLPRGFMLVVQLAQKDFRTLWNMYEFGAKVRATLYPRKDELVVFRNTLPSFQYIDGDQSSRVFPKEPVSHCEVALFEKVLKETGPTGVRTWHKGFRVAAVTGPRTRTLSGVHHGYPPSMPVQFGFFRTEKDAPALSLRFEGAQGQRGRMVLTFSEDKERIRFHSLLTGTAINHDERIVADVALKGFTMAQSLREPLGMAPFSRMPWKAARVVNEETGAPGSELPPTVQADKLRVVLEYQNGTVTDRVNVGPGELRIRLEVSNAKVLRLMRAAQSDMTMSVSEAQVPKELPRNLADALHLAKTGPTIRSLEFPGLKELHEVQAALTGWEVLFDGLAATLAITRRHMIVPIHKKWEAGYTRIQVVRQEDKVELLAFFEEFQHGHCMNFVLRGTDIYESLQRGSKAGVKFVDAKFPLPRLPVDRDDDFDEVAFISLDLPDLPGEHDDITILFEKETDRDRFAQCLPAAVKGSSRISSKLK